MERTCQASGEWSGTAPTCNRMFLKTLITLSFHFSLSLFYLNPFFLSLTLSLAVDCEGLTAPLSGQVALNSTTFQSVAAYECDSGFNLEGDMERTCQASGEWSGAAPTCNRMFPKMLITVCLSFSLFFLPYLSFLSTFSLPVFSLLPSLSLSLSPPLSFPLSLSLSLSP